ncbi:TauD/TfdA dioxygenase family protein [Amycolatopsis saalfeldensis]|uniref:Taurine dioxygenase n=1 Tax=Amycolatopsis saalfeldensis TaxID=394193 RepID=A0A1H8YNT7_9PSEU|nr:TauD/TfdA family dioxygenase [Amycolatopsis saalfeldensis]SEP53743.1 taurine dioxygenase [Amycolatopsis saalfeldensis]
MPFTPRPLDDTGFGAIVDGDLTSAEAGPAVPALLQALHRHRLLIFPRQHLNHADLLAAARCFGTVDTGVDRRYAVGGFPGLTTISNIVEHGTHVGIYDGDDEEEWHADNSFKPQLTRATMLYSVITPEQGGQTRFADATRAYADLPADLKQRIEDLRAVHSIQHLGALQRQAGGGQSSAAAGTLAGDPEVEHPLVLQHPVTGTRSLLLGSMVIRHIAGLSDEESGALLADLLKHATRAQYVHTHRWSRGDLVIWDNLATLHTASPCDSSRHHRLLYRASVH